MSARDEERLHDVYVAFNARDIDGALELMHPDVDWPNAWEGGRVRGREAVRAYWTRQFESIRSTVEPERFERRPDGSIVVAVHQVVRDPQTDALLSDSHVVHRYWLDQGLVARMDVEEA